MSRNFPASTGRLLLACVLSLLALTFAVEAKIAWYGPVAGPGSEIRAAKALPIDTRAIRSGNAMASHPIPLQTQLFFVVTFGIACAQIGAWQIRESRNALGVSQASPASSYFTPQISFRPPPVR